MRASLGQQKRSERGLGVRRICPARTSQVAPHAATIPAGGRRAPHGALNGVEAQPDLLGQDRKSLVRT